MMFDQYVARVIASLMQEGLTLEQAQAIVDTDYEEIRIGYVLGQPEQALVNYFIGDAVRFGRPKDTDAA